MYCKSVDGIFLYIFMLWVYITRMKHSMCSLLLLLDQRRFVVYLSVEVADTPMIPGNTTGP